MGKLHVGLKGIIASIYLDDLVQKTRRGQVGRVRAGRIPGGRSYGYDVVAAGDDPPLPVADMENRHCRIACRAGKFFDCASPQA